MVADRSLNTQARIPLEINYIEAIREATLRSLKIRIARYSDKLANEELALERFV